MCKEKRKIDTDGDERFIVVCDGDRFYVHDKTYPSTYLLFDSEQEANKIVKLLQESNGAIEIDEFYDIIDGEL